MKKLFLLAALLFHLAFSFGQTQGNGLLNALNDVLNTYNNPKNRQNTSSTTNNSYGRQKQINYTTWRTSNCYNFIQYRYGISWKGKPGGKVVEDNGGNGGDAYIVEIKNTSDKVIELQSAIMSNSNSFRNKIEAIGGGWNNKQFIINWVTGSDNLMNPGETIEGGGHLNANDKVVFEILGVKILNWSDKNAWGDGRMRDSYNRGLHMQFTKCTNGEECPWCEIYENSSRVNENEEMVQNWKPNYDKWCKSGSTKQSGNVQNNDSHNVSNVMGDKPLKAEISNEEGQIIISTTASKDLPQATQNIINIFTSLGYKYINTTIGDHHYPNKVTIDFEDNFIISLNPVIGTKGYSVIIGILGNKYKVVEQLKPILPYLFISDTYDVVHLYGFKNKN